MFIHILHHDRSVDFMQVAQTCYRRPPLAAAILQAYSLVFSPCPLGPQTS
jgi:hypothetical protein